MKKSIAGVESDWITLGSGLSALACCAAAMGNARWFQLSLPIQLFASLLVLVGAVVGWRSGSRSMILTGACCAALSWVPLGALLASCYFTGDCI